MAKSKAQKARIKKIREGRLDPAKKRGISPEFSTHERQTPSKVKRIRRSEKKHKGFIKL